MSLSCLRAEDDPEESIFFGAISACSRLLQRFDARELETAVSAAQEKFLTSNSCSTSFPGGDLVDGSPPVAHIIIETLDVSFCDLEPEIL